MPQINDTVAYPADGADAAQFRRLANGFTNPQTGTTYTLTSADNGIVVTLSNASAITVTVPSGLGENFTCTLWQIGAGQVSVTPGSGVTLNSYSAQRKILGQYASAVLWAKAADDFLLDGAITP